VRIRLPVAKSVYYPIGFGYDSADLSSFMFATVQRIIVKNLCLYYSHRGI